MRHRLNHPRRRRLTLSILGWSGYTDHIGSSSGWAILLERFRFLGLRI